MAKTEQQSKWRFYRSSMPTIVWDPANERALADFSKGHFTTDDPKVAEKLKAMGYLEIPLDATEPPDIIIRPPAHVIEGDVPVIRGTASESVVESRMEKVPKKRVVDPQTASVPEPKKKAAKKKPSKTTGDKKKSSPRKLKKRRKKTDG